MTQEQLKEVLHKKIADAGFKDCANKVAEMMFDLYEKGFRDGIVFAIKASVEEMAKQM